MASYKMLRLVHVRRWEKRNRSNAYWEVVRVRDSIQYGGIETFYLGVRYSYTTGGYMDIRRFELVDFWIFINNFLTKNLL